MTIPRCILAAALAAAFALSLHASPITGDLAIAGLSQYNPTGIDFTNPAFVLTGTGNFGSFPVTVDVNNLIFASAPSFMLFSADGITMTILDLMVVTNNNQFLNVAGHADFAEA